MTQNSDNPAIEAAKDLMRSINQWLMDNPAIMDEAIARDSKGLLDRAKLSLDDMTDERRAQTDPLTDQVKAINSVYRPHYDAIETLMEHLRLRLSVYLNAEAAKKQAALEEAIRERARKEMEARDAEKLEQERLADAAAGELDVDVAALTDAANAAFGEYEAAHRAAKLAERETNVRIGGGFRRAIGLRKKETLKVIDLMEVFDEIEMTEGIEAEVIKAAKAYRKAHGRLPKGIEATITEGV